MEIKIPGGVIGGSPKQRRERQRRKAAALPRVASKPKASPEVPRLDFSGVDVSMPATEKSPPKVGPTRLDFSGVRVGDSKPKESPPAPRAVAKPVDLSGLQIGKTSAGKKAAPKVEPEPLDFSDVNVGDSKPSEITPEVKPTAKEKRKQKRKAANDAISELGEWMKRLD